MSGRTALTLPSRLFRDPLQVLIDKENAIENQIKNCRGCRLQMSIFEEVNP